MAPTSVTIRQFDEESMRKLARMADDITYLRREIRSLRARPGFSYPNTARVGIAYGNLSAASGTTPGSGDVKFYRLEETDPSLGDLDELPTTVYNISSEAVAEGNRVICWLDLSGKYNGDTSPVWITGEISGGDFAEYYTQICKDSDQTIATDSDTVIIFQDAINLRTTDQQSWDDTGDGVADGIVLHHTGWYRIGYSVSWEGPTTSAGGSGVVIDSGTLLLGFTPDGTGYDPIDCSKKKTPILHDNATGASLGGNASTEVLFQNTNGDPNVVKLFHTGAGATLSRTFIGQCCVMWAEYLGHNATSVTTHTTTP